MSGRQFGFLAGFLFVWLWVSAGFLSAVAAVVVGILGYMAGRVLDGEVDLHEWIDRFSASRH